MPLTPGTRLGPYEIRGALGAGGMGEVYEARDTRLDRVVAVKVLPPQLAGDPAARARFDREARAIAALNHPNICALHDIGHDAGHDFLVMERLEGETLQQRLLRGPLDVAQVLDYGIALADALDAAHARGLIHRDLKPGNVFITSRGTPKILDFGLAKSLAESAPDVTRLVDDALTVSGTSVGTIAYMSPEQLRAEPLDVRTDLFSMGLVLYEMATGKRAFTGSTSAVISAGILSQEPPAPRSIRGELPVRLEEAILKTLEKDLTLRCQTAAELRADLTRARRQGDSDPQRIAAAVAPTSLATPAPVQQAADRPVAPPLMPAPEPGRQATRSARRRRRWATILIIVGLSWVIWGGRRWPIGGPFGGPPRGFGQQANAPAEPALPPPDVAAVPPLESTQPGPSGSNAGPPRRSAGGAPPGEPPPSPASRGPGPPPSPATPPPDGVGPPPDRTELPGAGAATPGTDPGPGRRGGRGRGARALGPAGNTLVAMLKNAPPETYDLVFAANDPDARMLAYQFRAALTNAGWTNASTLEIPEPQATFGIFAPSPSRGLAVLTKWAINSGFNPEIRQVPSLMHPRLVVGKQR